MIKSILDDFETTNVFNPARKYPIYGLRRIKKYTRRGLIMESCIRQRRKKVNSLSNYIKFKDLLTYSLTSLQLKSLRGRGEWVTMDHSLYLNLYEAFAHNQIGMMSLGHTPFS